MAQWSGPIAKGTDAERQFTDVLWRHLNGAEAGIVGDLDGTAYAVSLPPDSDVAQIGSSTQDSVSHVAGFAHIIDAGAPVGITIPAAATERTDLIVARYTPDTTGLPGPVQLARIAGTSSGIPAYDDETPGIEDMPLWAVTRRPGQALSQATVRDLRRRVAESWTLAPGAPLPLSSPLGSIVRQGRSEFERVLDGSGVPVWRPLTPTVLRSVGRQGNHLTNGGASQPFGSATSGRLVIPEGAADRAVRIDCSVEVYCPSSAPTAGSVRLYSNTSELLPNPNDWGTFHNRTGVGYGPRPANAHVTWEGVLSGARQNIWLNVAADPNSQEVWITGFHLTVTYR